MLVYNAREVDLLLMHNKSFAAEIAHGVSSRKRTMILERFVGCFFFVCVTVLDSSPFLEQRYSG
jgi:ribosomal protein L32E